MNKHICYIEHQHQLDGLVAQRLAFASYSCLTVCPTKTTPGIFVVENLSDELKCLLALSGNTAEITRYNTIFNVLPVNPFYWPLDTNSAIAVFLNRAMEQLREK